MIDYARPATMDDVRHVAENMREEDIEEVGAFMLSPLTALTIGFNNSDLCYTLLSPEGEPAAIMGISPQPYFKGFGSIWLLGTPLIEKYPMTFLRNTKPVLQGMFEDTGYDAFYNYTYAKNLLHHKWLKWTGFTFLRKVNLPPLNEEFFEFIILRG